MHIDLPLHGGHCPPWLFEKMTNLAETFLILYIKEKGPEELFIRLSDPLWFQALGNYLGFDWHSSGLTTVVGWVLAQSLKKVWPDIWIFVAWGKWIAWINTPHKIDYIAERYKIFWADKYKRASRIVARVDRYLLQDGFDLYYHIIFFDLKGRWTVVQQGKKHKWARRYHRNWKIGKKLFGLLQGGKWLNIEDFKIARSKKESKVLNLLSVKSQATNQHILELVRYIQTKHKMPEHHWIQSTDFNLKKLINTLVNVRQNLDSLKDLIGIQGIWPKAIFNLVQTSQLIWWDKPDWEDPARFSFTHGGKDGTPYKPWPQEFDETINNLKILIDKAKQASTMKKIYIQYSLFNDNWSSGWSKLSSKDK